MRLTRAGVSCRNEIAGHRIDLPVGNDWLLRDDHSVQTVGVALSRIGLMVSGRPAALFCPPGLIAAVLGAQGRSSPDLLPLCIELALEPLLDRLEAVAGCTVVVTDIMAAASAPSGGFHALALDAFGRAWPLRLVADLQTLAALLHRWPRAPLPADRVTVPATMRLGTTRMPAGVLRTVQPGDAVLIERGSAGPRAMLVVAETMMAPAHWDGREWQLHHAPRSGDAEREEWLGMNDTAPQNIDDGDAILHEDALPVTLCFDVGRLELSLGALQKLGAGSVLELPGSAETPIRITIGGRHVGTGELVDVEGRAGVRVIRIFERG